MRAPPAVSVEAHPGFGWRAVQTLLHAAAAGAAALWLSRRIEAGPAGAWAVACLAVLAGALGWRLSALPSMRITWSGARWSLAVAGADACDTSAPQVMLDLGRWMLLRIRPLDGGRTRWAALARADAGASWQLFRAAVYSFASDLAPRSPEERPPF
jgi:hypothetical protein